MKSIDKLGWIIAAGLTGLLAGTGFQGATPKFGSVDLEKVFNDSDYVKKQNDALRALGTARQDLLEFIDANKAMDPAGVARLRAISLKDVPTPAEKTESDKIKSDALGATRAYRDLQTKANPTETDKAALRDFSTRVDSNNRTLQTWNDEFRQELANRQGALRTESLNRAKDAVKATAKDQGFSIIFVEQVAPYAANDITDASLKAMNAKK